MNILLCHERFLRRFGVDRVLLALAREFRRCGHQVTLLGFAFDETSDSPESADRIVRIPAPPETLSADVVVAAWLADHWEEHFAGAARPDIALVAGWPFFSAIPIFEARGCRVIYQDHGIIPTDGLPEIGWRTLHLIEELKRTFLREASGVVAVSEFIHESQTRACVPSGTVVWVIPNGVDHIPLPATDPAPEKRRSGPRILCPGRFEPGSYKQSEFIFALERRVRAWAPEAWIGCFGSPEALAAVAGGDEATQVVALGEPTDAEMAGLVAASDVVVVFSRWEGFNLPLAEAQRQGRPCLVFNIGAHPEVVAHPWLLCADIEDMAAKVRALADGVAPAEIRDGVAFRTWAADKERSWSAIAGRYLELFQRVAMAERIPTPTPASGRRPSVLVDATNAVRDPSNSGCVRVARRLGAEWQAYLDVTFVVWVREAQAFRFPTPAEFLQLGAFQGPMREPTHPVSEEGAPHYLEPWLAREFAVDGAERPGWMLLPEIRHRPDLWPILEFAARARLKTASIFHDAIPLVRPELVPDPAYREGHADYMRGLSRVDVSLANSRASAAALQEFWRAEGLSGRVMPCLLPGGLPGDRPRPGEAASTAGAAPTVLMVSTLEPRKGHRRLIEAFLAVRAQARHPDWRLVLVGGRLWWSNEIAEFVEAASREHPEITWLEDAPDDRLRQLYRDCAFTVYASEIEGFGLPIMESVWHGRPCLCHDAGVMRELAAGGGCRTADLLDAAAFQSALLGLMNDEALRDRLAAECRVRSVKRWRDFAAEFWARLAFTRWSELEMPERNGSADEPVAEVVAGRLSFIIPTYNRLDLLHVCLESLDATLPDGLDAEIIVIDDASSDGTQAWLQRLHGCRSRPGRITYGQSPGSSNAPGGCDIPETALTCGAGPAARMRVIRHPTNRGYGASINRAARLATGERLVLLNHDLRFAPGWLEPMLDTWDQRPGRFAVGNLQHATRDGSLDHAGIVFDPTGHPEHFRAEPEWLRRVSSREFPAITFACALVDRRKFLALGGVDASFLNGFEDVDVCLRARFQGWPSIVATGSVVEHQISATPGRKLAEAENRHRFFARWQPLAAVLGRDWEERLAWERAKWSGMPDDRRMPGSCRVLIDLTASEAHGVADTVRRVLDDLTRGLTGEAGLHLVPLFVGTPEQVSAINATLPDLPGGAASGLLPCEAPVGQAGGCPSNRQETRAGSRARACAGPEVWAFDGRAGGEFDLSAGSRVVSGPAITVARRLEADVLYAPHAESAFVSPDVPVLVPDDRLAQRDRSRLQTVAYRHSECAAAPLSLGERAIAVARAFAASGVSWRWSDAARDDGHDAAPGREASPRPPHEMPHDNSDQILCCIDEPVRWEEPVPLVEIRGWCVHRDGAPLTGISVRTADGRSWRGVIGRARPDVAAALPTMPTAGASGFSVRVSASAGPFELWAAGADFSVLLRTWNRPA